MYREAKDRSVGEKAKIGYDEAAFSSPLESLLTEMGAAYLLVESTLSICGGNRAAEELLGWSIAEIKGESLLRIVPERSRRAFQRVISQDFSAGRSSAVANKVSLKSRIRPRPIHLVTRSGGILRVQIILISVPVKTVSALFSSLPARGGPPDARAQGGGAASEVENTIDKSRENIQGTQAVVLRDLSAHYQWRQQLKQRFRELEILQTITEVLSSARLWDGANGGSQQSQKFSDLGERVLRLVLNFMGAESGAILLFDHATGTKSILSSHRVAPPIADFVQQGLISDNPVSEQVIKTGAVIFSVSQVVEIDLRLAELLKAEGYRAFAFIPIVVPSTTPKAGPDWGTVAGEIAVGYLRPVTELPVSKEILKSIGSQVGAALANARLYQQAEKARQNAEKERDKLIRLQAAATELQRTSQVDQQLKVIADSIRDSGFEVVALSLRDKEFRLLKLVCVGMTQAEQEALRRAALSPEEWRRRISPEFDQFKIGEFYYFPWSNPEARPFIPGNSISDEPAVPGRWHPNDLLYLPLRGLRQEFFGVLSLDRPVEKNVPTADSLRIIELFAREACEALENALLHSQLERSEEKYRGIFENAAEGIFQLTAEGTFITVNPAFAHMLGYEKPEEVIGLNCLKDLGVAPAEKQENLYLLETQGVLSDRLLRLKRKDGKIITGLVNARAIKDARGAISIVEGFFEDVTEKQALQQQLLQAQKIESLGTLAGGIAHDFNNILGGIMGYASLVLAKLPADSPYYHNLELIFNTARRAGDLTSQLLTYARGGQTESKPVAINQIVQETIEILKRTLDKSIQIESFLTEELANVLADEGQIEQVLVNICLNARDAMPAGGRLVIETSNVFLDEVFARQHLDIKPGAYVLLLISDTGEGMDEATRQRIFEPFFSTKERGKGTGLGLAMVYGIVKNHGGHISVYSEIGRGTRFQIYLPALREPVKITTAPEMTGIKTGTGTILVVDDEPIIREVMKEILETAGYVVLVAANGKEAVEIYRSHWEEIDLVILDMIMPVLPGRETFHALCSINPQCKVLLASGYSQNSQVQTILREGVRGFLAKPFQVSSLTFSVQKVLAEK